MHNKNIYKKLCTATISLGLLFSIGQFAYAHDPNLYDAEELAASNPTLKNLKHLRSLYKMDIKQHYANGENDEAKEAEQKLQKTQVQIITKYEDNLKYQIEAAEKNAYKAQIIAFRNETSKNYALLVQRYDALAELANTLPKYSEKAIEYQIKAAEAKAKQANLTISESRWSNIAAEQYEALAQRWDALAELANTLPKYSEKAIEYQIKAAKAIAMQLNIIGRHNTTAEQYEALAQRWDAVVELAKLHPIYSKYLLEYQVKAAKAREIQQYRIISQNGRTPGNYETLAQRYDELSQLYNLDGQYADAARYKLSAIDTMLSMVNLTEDFDEKCNAYERAIAHNDNAATLAEASGWHHDSVAEFKEKAAESRIKLAKTILEHESTLDNYDNWVRSCEELVQLFDEYEDNGLRYSRNVAAIARVNAAKARVKRAQFIAEQHETVENYDMLMQCWNEVAELSEIFINEYPRYSFYQHEVVEEARINAAIARAKRAKFIAEQHETVENYDMLMQCWNEVAELSEIFINEYPHYSFHQHEVVEKARREAELAMDKRNFAAMIRQSTFLSIAALLGKK